ncbi:MAG: BREX system P-loop protein BrxC [Longimonas sp.]|uniref:BREX system P-loop protein BrxC n=1 Tax=Longimonas sp. TaxID=2039626 RepID=UPI003349A768
MPTSLHTLYERDIERNVESVAVVDNRDEELIEQEIKEYFFTDPLFENIKTFLETLTGGPTQTTGFWINGFYGSGKSHFLKFLYYLMAPAHQQAAFDHFIGSISDYEGDPFDQPLKDAQANRLRKAVEALDIAPIMFNISAFAQQDETNAQTVTQTFYNRFNQFRGYHKSDLRIARFEQQLDERGTLEAFKQAYADQKGEDWEASALMAVDFHLSDVIEAVKTATDLDPASTRKALERDITPSTDAFVDELNQFLEGKPDNYRLVFLVDEVSQFMAGNENMLVDLQTIVESIGSRCGNKVWVAGTAQQELKELLDTTNVSDVKDAFGKIIARFTPLPLEAQQADRIAKKRILEKNEDSERILKNFYAENERVLRNQFARDNDVYRGIDTKEEFVESYPFVPYQFTLIENIIYSFVQEDFLMPGVSGTERSLIGITHETAKNCKDESLGYIVPLDAFYNKQIRDSLKHYARKLITDALDLPDVQAHPFWQRVVKALFLLSHLVESKQINFPATVENIAFVLMDEVDQDKAKLQRTVQEALDYLVDQNVVSKSDGQYRFLQEEEMQIKKRIDNTKVRPGSQLDFLEKKIVAPGLQWERTVQLDGAKIKLKRKVDSKEIGSSGTIPVQVLITNNRDPNQLAFDRGRNELVFCLSEAFGPEQQATLREIIKVDLFKQANYDSASGKRRKAIDTFAKQSKAKLKALQNWFEEALLSCTYISTQQVQQASEHTGGTAPARYNDILDAHLRRIYKKRDMASGYADSRRALKKQASGPGELDKSLTTPEQEVNSYLKRQPMPNVRDVINHFSGVPYGWKDTETLHLLLNLRKKNRWRFKWNSEEISPATFAEQAVNRSEQASITLHEQASIDPALLHNVHEAINRTIFNKALIPQETDPRALNQAIESQLTEQRQTYDRLASEYRDTPFAHHFAALRDAFDDILDVRGTEARFQQITQQASALGEQLDTAVQLKQFVETNGDAYMDMRAFVSRKKREFEALQEADRAYAEKLVHHVEQNDRPDTDFRTMKQFYESVQEALSSHIDALKSEVKSAFEEAFDALESYRDEHGVDNILPEREQVLQTIEQYNSVQQLELEKRSVGDFQTRYRTKIRQDAEERRAQQQRANTEEGNAAGNESGGSAPAGNESASPSEPASNDAPAPRQTVTFSVADAVGTPDLETEDDVDAFVQALRDKLMQEVSNDTVIMIVR